LAPIVAVTPVGLSAIDDVQTEAQP
jgi:hypothetical protein